MQRDTLLVPLDTIHRITGCTQPAAQLRRLHAMGLPAWRNALGEICVTVAALERWNGASVQVQNSGPQLKSIRSAT
jgi:hypothetical protein